jgi:lipoprotein-anchoring transpeptidase ErfK/SrfK
MQQGNKIGIAIAFAAAILSAGCVVSEKKEAPADSTAVSTTTTPAAQPMPMDTMSTMGMADSANAGGLRVEVDLNARQLHFYKGGQDSAETYPVAVGSDKWPTQPGSWTIKQVVWNPEWTPPDESWAEEREPRKPGDPKNPLGRAQLVYDPPRTIHGTNQPSSIGKNVSHGSIRMRNEDIIKLGKELMDLTGAGKDSAFFKGVATKRTEKVVIDLPKPVPIKVF